MAIRTSNDAFYPELEDLRVGQQFVFYGTLLGAKENFNPYAWNTGRMAREYLYKKNIFNPKTNTEPSFVIKQAMDMLEKSWRLEERKERNYIRYLSQKMPDNPFLKKTNIDFMDLILELNRQQKSAERAQQYIDYERKRWADYRENFEKIEEAKDAFISTRHLDKDDQRRKDVAGEYHSLRTTHLGQSIQRKVGTIDTQFFSSFSKNKNTIVNILKEVVINEFGSDIFVYKKDGLQIDQLKTNRLINILIKMIYEQLVITSAWKGQRSSSRKKDIATNVAQKIFGKTKESKQALIQSLLNTSVENTSIDELRQKLTTKEQQDLAERAKKNDSKIKPLIQQLKKLYKEETGKTKVYDKAFTKWMQSKGYSENYKDQLLQELTLIEDIKVDIWFESERKGLEEILAQNFDAYLNGNVHNLKSDIEAGKLVIEISVDSDNMNKKASDQIQKYERQMWKTQQSFIQQMSIGADKDSYEQNYEKFVLAREEQMRLLNELEELLKQQQIDIKQALTYFNVHTSVKDQTGNLYLDKGSGFTGGAIGRNDSALSFIDNINMLYARSGSNLSSADLAWLKVATLNAGQGLIGSRNKQALEGYFAMFVDYLMFDDAQNIVADAFSDYSETLDDTVNVQDIHLYIFNGVYVPLSYVLRSIWQSMQAFTKDMHRYERNLNTGTSRVTLSTYNVSGNPGYTEEAWYREAERARKATKVKAILMTGFLDLLNQLEQKLQNPL